MLTYRRSLLLVAIAYLVLVVVDCNQQLSSWVYLVPALLLLLAIVYGSYFIQSGFFLKAYCSGNPGRNQIAITFDDGPHENTPQILDILKKHHAKAAFFCIGKNMHGKVDLLDRMVKEGHLIGNHSFSHHNFFDFFLYTRLANDVSKADELIEAVTGRKNRLFRPPFGVTTPRIARLAREKKYAVVGWNLRSYDTSIRDRNKLLSRIFSRMKNGSVILLHDTTPGISDIVEQILLQAGKQHLEVVGVDRLFGINSSESV